MKTKIVTFLALLALTFGYAQDVEFGPNFEFDKKNEKDLQFVLNDNYNHYMLSVVMVDGMMARRQMIVRKFDQKNQMLDKFVYDFPKFDISTLYNYLGFTESNGKVAVFTQTYSGKAKKSVISAHVFDKATNQFTTTELASTPILSAMKSGSVSMQKSDNGRMIGINYTMHQAKEEPEKNLMLMIDAGTLNKNWEKEFAFTDKYRTRYFTVTNSGKVVYVRMSKGMKQHNYLVVGSPEGQEEKQLETEILLHQPKAISIGTQDYIFAFNHALKGIRAGDYPNLLLYDLQNSKTINNAKVSGFGVKGTTEVQMQHVFIQNNEIHLFAESKFEAGTKPGATNGFSSTQFPETVYNYGQAHLVILGLDGTLKKQEQINIENGEADLHHSYGMVNIKGNYYVHTGVYRTLPERFPGMYMLTSATNFDMPKNWIISPFKMVSDNTWRDYLHQMMYYFPDSNKLLMARIMDDREMSLLYINNFVK